MRVTISGLVIATACFVSAITLIGELVERAERLHYQPTWTRLTDDLCAVCHRGLLTVRSDAGESFGSGSFGEFSVGLHVVRARVIPEHDIAVVEVDGGPYRVVDDRPGVTVKGTRACQ